jgi:Ras-related C3 botulinum toxin substrate 1
LLDNYTFELVVEEHLINLELWNSVQEDDKQERKLRYTSADVAIIVYSVIDRSTFDNALNKVAF